MAKKSQSGTDSKPVSKTSKAGLILPISRVLTHYKRMCKTKRVSYGAPLYATAVVQAIMTEVIDEANQLREQSKANQKPAASGLPKQLTVTRQHVMQAVRGTEQLNQIFAGYTFASGSTLAGPGNAIKSKSVLEYNNARRIAKAAKTSA